jgi:CTP synthase
VNGDLRQKIALFCDVAERAVIPLVTTSVLYEVPLILEQLKVADIILDRLSLEARATPDWREWQELVERVRQPKPAVRVALVGKYVELQDAYMSVREALKHAGLALGREVEIEWIHSADLEKGRGWELIRQADGIVVPGGFGSRGIEGKIAAARYARENQVPYLGLCLGMQTMCIEFARHALGTEDANSTEFDRSTPHPVIDLLPEQRDIADLGGTMRLGVYPCKLVAGSKADDAYDLPDGATAPERHRHRFEFNNGYREQLGQAGMVFSGLSPDERLVEIAELADHPFMLGTQFHPEFLSRPNRPHPLFRAFVAAVAERTAAAERAAAPGERPANGRAEVKGAGEPTSRGAGERV